MSHFYGTLQGQAGEATRCGSKQSGLETYTASWKGAVRTYLYYDAESGQDIALIELVPWQSCGSNLELYHGPVNGDANDILRWRETHGKN